VLVVQGFARRAKTPAFGRIIQQKLGLAGKVLEVIDRR
jgi:hypothetical protein